MRKAKLFLLIAFILTLAGCNNDTRHKAVIYKTKKHHVVMRDDQGKWWAYTLKNLDIDFDIPFNAKGEMVLPTGGSWRPATLEEEDEITVEGEATNAEVTTVDETDAGTVDGSGDVGGDSGGADGGARSTPQLQSHTP